MSTMRLIRFSVMQACVLKYSKSAKSTLCTKASIYRDNSTPTICSFCSLHLSSCDVQKGGDPLS
jgi:hypothetical protein